MKLEQYFLCIQLENVELKVELIKQQKENVLFSNPAVTAVHDSEKISSRKATRTVAVTACALCKGGQD